jgi:diaminohydroxyphosphoribosylaminopyrimidine deaminase/5-amino-6-(5-phosphoribosylamino)uracil reductase
MTDRSPVRVMLDGSLRLPLDSRLLASARDTPLWVMTRAPVAADRMRALTAKGAEVIEMVARNGKLDLLAAIKLLAERGITRLMVEAGPILAVAFLNADLVDEVVLFRASHTLGANGIDALEGLPLEALTRSPRLELVGKEQAGADMIELFRRR